jgi:hypothetical protein
VANRTFSHSRFRHDAVKRAAPSFRHENLIAWGNISRADLLIVDISEKGVIMKQLPPGSVHMTAATILEKENLKVLLDSKNPIVIASDDPGAAAGIWMVLSQMGVDSLLILDSFGNNEVPTYEFRPDSMIQAGIH